MYPSTIVYSLVALEVKRYKYLFNILVMFARPTCRRSRLTPPTIHDGFRRLGLFNRTRICADSPTDIAGFPKNGPTFLRIDCEPMIGRVSASSILLDSLHTLISLFSCLPRLSALSPHNVTYTCALSIGTYRPSE